MLGSACDIGSVRTLSAAVEVAPGAQRLGEEHIHKPLLELRGQIDTWVTPRITIGVSYGQSLVDLVQSSVALTFGFYVRAFDGVQLRLPRFASRALPSPNELAQMPGLELDASTDVVLSLRHHARQQCYDREHRDEQQRECELDWHCLERDDRRPQDDGAVHKPVGRFEDSEELRAPTGS